MINKYEAERVQFKAKIKELSDEITIMHGREIHGSDEDSPSQLSEIDRQQELLGKISAKNKHIKRLLRDIEKFEQQSTTHLNVIKELKRNVEDSNEKISLLSTQLEDTTNTITFLEEKIAQLSTQLHEMENENQQMFKERYEREKEMENFSKELEERVLLYKGILDEKQHEFDILNERYENLIEQVPGIDIESDENEIKRISNLINDRDKVIKAFEEKLQLLSTKLMESTEIIKKLSEERKEFVERLEKNKSNECCVEVQDMLKRGNEERKELQEMLQIAEDDNFLKSKQAFEAIEILRSYENSEDGLADALKKIHSLQEAVFQRDKQIHEFVTEINAQNEVAAENSILRKRLGISDDEIVETKAFLARQKRYAKINDRLMLKLRASEELRLQLKIDKNELKRNIYKLEAKLNNEGDENLNSTSRSTSPSLNVGKGIVQKRRKESHVEMRQCENCSNIYNVYESLKYCRNCIMKHNSNLCENCTSNLKVTSSENIELIKKIAKLEIDYQSISEENENLRVGLNEILEKLRDNEDTSSSNTNGPILNPATLEKLFYILNLRNNMKTSSSKTLNKVTSSANTFESDDKNKSVEKNREAVDETLKLKLLIKDLSDENEAIRLELVKRQHVEEQYEELVTSSKLCDDDKYRLMVKSLERCHEFESNLEIFERKIDFLNNENDNLHHEIRKIKVSSIEVMNDMKMEILRKTEKLLTVNAINEDENEKEEIKQLEEELHEMRFKLNGLCFNVLKNLKTLDENNVLKIETEKFSNLAILENNLTTSFMTRSELNEMKSKLLRMQETINMNQIREKHLEELTKISQQQLKAQQLMLTQFSDDEIASRHLIVDLQSQSNENYLLTKTARDLKISKENEEHLKLENDKLKFEIKTIQDNIQKVHDITDDKLKEMNAREKSNLLKIQYLRKSLIDLCNQYSSMTPMYLITDFVKHYAKLLEAKKEFEIEMLNLKSQSMPELSYDSIATQLKDMSMTDIEGKIEIIKYKSSCDYLKQQLQLRETTIKELHNEIARIRLNEIKSKQHWNAIRMLFGDKNGAEKCVDSEQIERCDKCTQIDVIKKDCGTITDKHEEMPKINAQQPIMREIVKPQTPPISQSVYQIKSDDQNSLEMQLKKALSLASSRSSLLIETENRLSEAQGRIKALERNFENQLKQQQQQQSTAVNDMINKKDDHILSITIATLQNLILDKDTNLSRYQELLKSERQHNMRTFDELSEQIKQLKKVNDCNETTIDERHKAIDKLKQQIMNLEEEKLKVENAVKPVTPPPQQLHVTFKDNKNVHDIEMQSMEIKLKEAHTEVKKMEQQLKDLTNTERQLQNLIREKDILIKDLNIKLKASNDNLETLSESFTSHNEIEQLREMLEEKDKHIQDLTETLNQFHDDQQKYINDTALNSADQVQIISANLTRAETTNRVLATQLEALKRQVANIQQREKQSRDMIKTLKNQLIKRPVISVKSDKRPITTREEQQQKRINELENELLEVKDDLRRQININDNKKAKNAAELGLWDKQKRYQEMSEKLKGKLTEKEIDCERLKANLQMAKNSIRRLENEKIMLDNKIKNGRYMQIVGGSSTSSISCQHCDTLKHSQIAETPSIMSDSGSEMNSELVVALKSRIESQQRKIIAMELDGKGWSVSIEIDKIQEQLSEIQARNIRLEAKNIQLQLDNDLLKQNVGGQRQEARIKHLEE
ncbi:hypothetical protein ACKWTF_009920 [Chironomus riparius]